jgi:hypothetical protein
LLQKLKTSISKKHKLKTTRIKNELCCKSFIHFQSQTQAKNKHNNIMNFSNKNNNNLEQPKFNKNRKKIYRRAKNDSIKLQKQEQQHSNFNNKTKISSSNPRNNNKTQTKQNANPETQISYSASC